MGRVQKKIEKELVKCSTKTPAPPFVCGGKTKKDLCAIIRILYMGSLTLVFQTTFQAEKGLPLKREM